MSSLHSSLLAVLLVLCCQWSVTVSGKTLQDPLATVGQQNLPVSGVAKDGFPCIDDSLIAPCKCELDYFDNTKIRLDCSAVQSEEQFAAVFQQPWPVKELHELYMRGNSGLRVLRNVLNGITFEEVNIYFFPNIMEGVSEYFLLDCKDTLVDFRLENSNITSDLFPFSTFSQLEKLQYLRITGSAFDWIPPLLAPQLTSVTLREGRIAIIEAGTFPVYAGHTVISLDSNDITAVEPGSFTFSDKSSVESNEDIIYSLGSNQLVSVEADTFPLRDGNVSVYLSYNQISSIAKGTFVLPKSTGSLKLDISLRDNELTTFDEEVFGELLPFTYDVDLAGNPLLCGCDIAWIIFDAEKLVKIDYYTTCANGDYLRDLNPEDFETLCYNIPWRPFPLITHAC